MEERKPCREIDSQKITQYCILRNDLPPGAKFAQLAHAAGESFKRPNECRGSPIYAVVLAVPNERKLLKLADELEEASIPHKLIREPDPPYYGEAMAIGIEPMDRNRVKGLLKKLPLLK